MDKLHKEIAESEYNSYEVGKPATTNQDYLMGTTLDFNDNRSGNGEQIYAIASDGSNILPDAPLSKRAEVKEITILYRGSTNPLGVFTGEAGEVGKDWSLNNTVLGLKMLTEQKALSKR